MRAPAHGAALAALAALLLLFVSLVAVWWPVHRHFHVGAPPVMADLVPQLRSAPADAVLAEVAEQSLIADHPIAGDEAVALARRLLQGRLELPHSPPLAVSVQFDAGDLARGNRWQQLATASLIVPDLLLRAYETTGEEVFFQAARTYLLNFVDDEARRWRPVGELWNGHPIASRVAVIARFWRIERGRAPGGGHAATAVLAHLVRCAERLSKPTMFFVASNHGVMHNLALLQIAAAFPVLPDAGAYRALALRRLGEQMAFYVNGEGFVLEHSAGYHFHGVVLLTYIIRTLEMQGLPVPTEWREKRNRSAAVFRRLQRSDRTLPSYGDTMNYRWRLPQAVQAALDAADARPGDPPVQRWLYPVAGYAVANDRLPASGVTEVQTVVPWSYFADHPHRNAQEMSLLVWADGIDWITNRRYWPTDAQWGERAAWGWSGGNAPHAFGEPVERTRDTMLLASADAPGLRALDLERRNLGDGLRFRRQIVQVDVTRWLVLDTRADPARRPLRVLWTTQPDVSMSAPVAAADARGARFELRRAAGSAWMSIDVRASSPLVAQRRVGSRDPFAGWVSEDRRAKPAGAADLQLDDPDGWLLTVLRVQGKAAAEARSSSALSAAVRSADEWQVSLPAAEGPLRVVRRGMTIAVERAAAGGRRNVALTPGPDVGPERRAIANALAAVSGRYPLYQDIGPYRMKATAVLTVAWLLLCGAAWTAYRRWPARRAALAMFAAAVWSAASGWVVLVYLAV